MSLKTRRDFQAGVQKYLKLSSWQSQQLAINANLKTNWVEELQLFCFPSCWALFINVIQQRDCHEPDISENRICIPVDLKREHCTYSENKKFARNCPWNSD